MLYEHVRILFLSADQQPEELIAAIRRDEREMVIDISEGNEGPYLIRGHLAGSFYAGVNEVSDAAPRDIVARWAELGDIWIGWWSEEGSDYLFQFRLQRPNAR